MGRVIPQNKMGAMMSSCKKGFSIVEIAVTLIISSIIYVGFLGFFFNLTKLDKEKTTIEKLNQIEEAIGQYVRQNGYIPCPASRIDNLNSSNLGVPTDCTLSSATGTTDITVSASTIRIGAVPVAVLNLDKNTIFDGWTNRFTYIAVKELSTTQNSFKTYAATSGGPFIIRDKNANQVNISDDVGYIIISHGEKGYGSYNVNGTQVKACGTTLESENCNNDNIFINSKYYGIENASYYDDIMRWKTRSRLIKSNNLAIALP
jgi:type II secretory pathway pseudopilin PulG